MYNHVYKINLFTNAPNVFVLQDIFDYNFDKNEVINFI